MKYILIAILILVAACNVSAAATTLPAYNAPASENTVSGLSSGGGMATQLHIAYSSTFKKGVGIVASPPYYCAEGSVTNANGRCTDATSTKKPPTQKLIDYTKTWSGNGAIDNISNLIDTRVYIGIAGSDTIVKHHATAEVKPYYSAFVRDVNIKQVVTVGQEHSISTDSFGSSCPLKQTPYINNCAYEQAGDLLQWLYGPLQAPNTGTLSGQFIQFSQSEFVASGKGMAATGYVYVPATCAAGQSCKVHVALHGCKQDTTYVGDAFYRNAGYNRWADTNHIIVLYPQAQALSFKNPNGCWDWWNYTGDGTPRYAQKASTQMTAITKMVARINSGAR